MYLIIVNGKVVEKTETLPHKDDLPGWEKYCEGKAIIARIVKPSTRKKQGRQK